MFKRFLLAAAMLAFAAIPFANASTAAPSRKDYRLGVDDKLRLKVYEWRSSVGELQEWSALNGDYRVGPDGAISLPLIGAVPAAGTTLGQLASAISDRLQKEIGLSKRPSASLEIVRYRPFYVLGAVNRPGEYSYRPGITVLQALSIAGGLFRLTDLGLIQLRRSSLETIGNGRVLRLALDGLVAQRARLQAELNGRDRIAFPPDLLLRRRNDPAVAQLMAEEEQVFAARQVALRAQKDGLKQLRDLLKDELGSLGGKIGNADQELRMIHNELNSVTALVKKGLAVAPREFQMRQTEVELEGRRLDLDTAVLRAREEIAKSRQKEIDLQNDVRKEDVAGLRTTEAKIAKVMVQLRTDGELVQQDAAAEPELAAITDERRGKPVFTIVREVNGKPQQLTVSESTAVEPGDTITVARTPERIPVAGSSAGGGEVADPAGGSVVAEPRPAVAAQRGSAHHLVGPRGRR